MPTIKLAQGSYRGGTAPDSHVNYYHGIPYCQPFERLQPPKAIAKSTSDAGPDEVKDATQFGPICPQNPSKLEPYIYGPWPTLPNGGEADESRSGVLSVYQPESARTGGGEKSLLPVIVYAHGGAWQTGSSQINWYTGTALARDGECVVVTINYLVGVLGFLYQGDETKLACGNQDHILALEWVRDNIRSFGGDPENVTAAGQSAGAYNTQLLLDLRPDLFRRAIIMSSPADRAFGAEDAGKIAETVCASLPEGKTLESASMAEILAAQAAATSAHGSMVAQFAPVIADGVAPGGRHKVENGSMKKDVLVTWMQHDGSAFAAVSQGPKTTATDELSVKLTSGLFKEPSIRLAERLHKAGHGVAALEHQWAPEGYALGATHCLDLPLLLGDYEAWRKSPMHGDVSAQEWDRRGKLIRQAFGRFARNGSMPEKLEGTSIELYGS
ncbi:hypothetical protein B0A55_02779 [Friedmanniomyces simplex]|uniref:Carboxylesterase type B domain-containing protein n=1 Tax=Friedmanniomyces simplex TaxID=329884 RepID=A0A4U0XQP7_9PEZI|nr:hypothetical protein B0A55_02779 [Friedmanniomyces simplex]